MPWTIGTFKTLARTWINHASKGAWPHTSLWCKALLFALWGPLQVLCLKKAFSCCLPWWNCSQSSYLYNLFCFSLWLVLSFCKSNEGFWGNVLVWIGFKVQRPKGGSASYRKRRGGVVQLPPRSDWSEKRAKDGAWKGVKCPQTHQTTPQMEPTTHFGIHTSSNT